MAIETDTTLHLVTDETTSTEPELVPDYSHLQADQMRKVLDLYRRLDETDLAIERNESSAATIKEQMQLHVDGIAECDERDIQQAQTRYRHECTLIELRLQRSTALYGADQLRLELADIKSRLDELGSK